MVASVSCFPCPACGLLIVSFLVAFFVFDSRLPLLRQAAAGFLARFAAL